MQEESDPGGQVRSQGWQDDIAPETSHQHQQGHDPQEQEGAVAMLLRTAVRLPHGVFSHQVEDVMVVERAL